MVVTASLVVLGLAGSGSGRGRAFVRLSLRIPLLQLLLDHLGHLFAFGLVAAVALVDRIQDLCHGLFATLSGLLHGLQLDKDGIDLGNDGADGVLHAIHAADQDLEFIHRDARNDGFLSLIVRFVILEAHLGASRAWPEADFGINFGLLSFEIHDHLAAFLRVENLVSILVVFGEDGLDLEVRISASLELFAPFGEVDVTITVHVGALDSLLDVDDLLAFVAKFVHHLSIATLEVVADLKVRLLLIQFALDLSIGVVDDSQEHVHQNEEDEEDVDEEVHGAQNAVGILHSGKVEVSEDDTELGEDAVLDVGEVLNLGAENQVGQLAESQEDDEEHESESDHVLGAASQSARQLVHRLVEGNVLENLDPGEENGNGDDVVELRLPVAQEFEVGEDVGFAQKILQQLANLLRAEDVEGDADDGDADDDDVEDVPDGLEVFEAVLLDLDDLLDQVVDDEEGEDNLAGHDKVVHHRHVTEELDGAERPGWNETTGCRKFSRDADLAEQVDVGIVHGEVEEDGTGATVNPQVVVKLLNDRQGIGLVVGEILVESTAAIFVDLALVVGTVDVIGFSVLPGGLAGVYASLVGGEKSETEGLLVLLTLGVIGIAIVDVIFEVLVHLARMVGDFQHSDSGHAEEFGFVEDEAFVSSGHVAAVVPSLPVEAVDQRSAHEAPHVDHSGSLSESSLSLIGVVQEQFRQDLGVVVGRCVDHTEGKDAKNDDEDNVDDELAEGRADETLFIASKVLSLPGLPESLEGGNGLGSAGGRRPFRLDLAQDGGVVSGVHRQVGALHHRLGLVSPAMGGLRSGSAASIHQRLGCRLIFLEKEKSRNPSE